MACDASFLKHYHTPVIHFGTLHFKNEEMLYSAAGPISRYSLNLIGSICYITLVALNIKSVQFFQATKIIFNCLLRQDCFCNLQVSSFSKNLDFKKHCFAQILTELLISISALRWIMAGNKMLNVRKLQKST